ncbi:hypothetical protein GCK72_006486 [Caenorhabditis remanei]|uniref:Uncharacterized protein n=1 Tax=Caenorhabditis remanei TaxID=31234 RepID=A0A6A5HGV5_CAERE|nr:hypothetical protein GCK72_006486 [Caenorhabditis remanei]KAF1766529.1 hypothetical protein GCK72_006486 [Caenorhabditis remanei]
MAGRFRRLQYLLITKLYTPFNPEAILEKFNTMPFDESRRSAMYINKSTMIDFIPADCKQPDWSKGVDIERETDSMLATIVLERDQFHFCVWKDRFPKQIPTTPDYNGIPKCLHKGTGNKNKITITNDHNRLSPEDIERMINDADKFAADDQAIKEKVESRSELESYAYQMKSQIGDNEKLGGKLSDEDKVSIESAVERAIEWLGNNQDASTEENKEQKKELESVVQPIISKLYSAGGEGGEQAAEEPAEDHDEL